MEWWIGGERSRVDCEKKKKRGSVFVSAKWKKEDDEIADR